MLHRTTILLLAAGLAPLLAQPQRAPSDPEAVAFTAFFRELAAADTAAAMLKANGRNDADARNAIQNRIGLKDSEAGLVKEVARSCLADLDAQFREGAAVVGGVGQARPGQTPDPAVAARLNELQRERDKVVFRCIADLQRGLGAKTFKKVDEYILKNVVGKVRVVK